MYMLLQGEGNAYVRISKRKDVAWLAKQGKETEHQLSDQEKRTVRLRLLGE
jgi:hypothetical protein